MKLSINLTNFSWPDPPDHIADHVLEIAQIITQTRRMREEKRD